MGYEGFSKFMVLQTMNPVLNHRYEMYGLALIFTFVYFLKQGRRNYEESLRSVLGASTNRYKHVANVNPTILGA
eukprot:CAMPEP_0168614446 /NCGR_PEP_ID=MMETSP0449_2-20121227/3980_1 /TAXON_ID=1082188 /ORGANISM="Strombidium rassoulzadegani, Strain ras09" /LENGTH=73 /DNA_ID=CAMNT_0008655129 /DNA_START=242 /DNA_END=463 /DNA_ORIENTATION=-